MHKAWREQLLELLLIVELYQTPSFVRRLSVVRELQKPGEKPGRKNLTDTNGFASQNDAWKFTSLLGIQEYYACVPSPVSLLDLFDFLHIAAHAHAKHQTAEIFALVAV